MPKEKLTVGVTGGRTYNDFYNVQRSLTKVDKTFEITVVHGDAPGADSLARVWCERTGTPERRYAADWGKHGAAAGPIRNQQMVDEGGIQLLLAFPGGPGTADMIARCRAAGIPVKVIPARDIDDRSQTIRLAAA